MRGGRVLVTKMEMEEMEVESEEEEEEDDGMWRAGGAGDKWWFRWR